MTWAISAATPVTVVWSDEVMPEAWPRVQPGIEGGQLHRRHVALRAVQQPPGLPPERDRPVAPQRVELPACAHRPRARSGDVEMPIAESVVGLLDASLDARSAVAMLMGRDPAAEMS